MVYNPLQSLLSQTKYKTYNPYDDGTVWDNPDLAEEETTLPSVLPSFKPDLSSNPYLEAYYNNEQDKKQAEDPLANARNQITYNTQELQDMGMNAPAPSAWEKAKNTGLSALGTALKGIDIITKPVQAISNFASGILNRAVMDIDNIVANFGDSEKTLEYERNNPGLIMSGLKSAGNTIKTLWDDKAWDDTVNFGTIVKNMRENAQSEPITKVGEGMTYPISQLLQKAGLSEDSSEQWSDTTWDFATSLLLGKVAPKTNGLSEVGNTLKYLNNADKIDEANAIQKSALNFGKDMPDLTKQIKSDVLDSNSLQDIKDVIFKYTNDPELVNASKTEDLLNTLKTIKNKDSDILFSKSNDDLTSILDDTKKFLEENPKFDIATLPTLKEKEAIDSLINKVNEKYTKNISDEVLYNTRKVTGGMPDFEGLKWGNDTVLSREAIADIAKSKPKSLALQAGLTAYNPLAGIIHNPIVNKFDDSLSKGSPTYNALKDELQTKFGGRNSEYDVASRNDPNQAYTFQMNAKLNNLSRERRLENTKKALDELSSQMKNNPEGTVNMDKILKALETPEEKYDFVRKSLAYVQNPNYKKALNNELSKIIDNVKNNPDFVNAVKKGYSSEKRMDELINNLKNPLARTTKEIEEQDGIKLGIRNRKSFDDLYTNANINETVKESIPKAIAKANEIKGSKKTVLDEESVRGLSHLFMNRSEQVVEQAKSTLGKGIYDLWARSLPEDKKALRKFVRDNDIVLEYKQSKLAQMGSKDKTLGYGKKKYVDQSVVLPKKQELELRKFMVDKTADDIKKAISGEPSEIGEELHSNLSKLFSNKISDIERRDSAYELVKNLSRTRGERIINETTDMIEHKGDVLIKAMEKRFPDIAKKVQEKNSKYMRLIREFPDTAIFDNVGALNKKEKEIYNYFKTKLYSMALEEGLTEQEAKMVANYVPHILNPEIKGTKGLTSFLKQTGYEIDDPTSVFHKARKNMTPILQANEITERELGKKLFMQNIQQIYLTRLINHEKFMMEKNLHDQFFNFAGHKILTDLELADMPSSAVRETVKKLGGEITDMYKVPKYKFSKESGREFINIENMTPEEIAKIDKENFLPYSILKPKSAEERARIEAMIEKRNANENYRDFVYNQAKQQGMKIITKPDEYKKAEGHFIDREQFQRGINEIKPKLSEEIGFSEGSSKYDKNGVLHMENGYNPLDGYVVVDANKLSKEDFYTLTKGDSYLVPAKMHDMYVRKINEQAMKTESAMLDIFDKLNTLFKAGAVASGKFHFNNMVGNVFNSYVLAGTNILNPKYVKKAADMLMGKDFKVGKYTSRQVEQEMLRRGLLDTQLMNEFARHGQQDFLEGKIGSLLDTRTKAQKIKASLNPLNTNEFGIYKGSRWLGDKIETHAKMINFITHIENGKSFQEAENLTKKALFDYGDLSKFETDTVKRLIPFYTFMRKNLPSQLEAMMNHPERYKQVSSLYTQANRNLSEQEKGLRPDYTNNYLPIEGEGMANLALPMFDIDKITDPGQTLSSTNPIVKLALELQQNQQLGTGNQISRDNSKLEKAKYAGQSIVPITKLLENLYNSTLSSDNNVSSSANKKLSSWAGNPVTSYDKEKAQKQTMYEYLTELQNEVYKAKQNPELVKRAEEEQNKRKRSKIDSSKNPLLSLLKQ